ncbi:uncharacterized protein LOC127869999 [Dreissena polymorpha]|uniref:uncharacterized protein LOC127869999 n=1 Tax=Dreissena polymorpha TaxID=45954 RepID=UPI0022646E73|nr:uncharacterized protein LOC127869999 [Dreissena polymorpha]
MPSHVIYVTEGNIGHVIQLLGWLYGAFFSGVTIKGCVFHWTQAVWRKVQDLGLVTTYRRRQALYNYMRQLMALPFLPAAHIRETFAALRDRANTPQLDSLVTYMDRQWLQHVLFNPENWSIFRRSVRTNNDVEGWHHKLNTTVRYGGCSIYVLVPTLMTEAEIVAIAVAADDLDRDVATKYTKLEEKIQSLWDKYMGNEVSTTHFLKSVS